MLLSRLGDDAALTADINPNHVLDEIYRERAELQEEAISLGARFFEKPSTEFLTYMESIWGDGPTF